MPYNYCVHFVHFPISDFDMSSFTQAEKWQAAEPIKQVIKYPSSPHTL